MPCASDEGDSACGSAFGRTWEFHHCTGSSAPWRRHSHTFGGVLEDTQGAAPCEAEQESLEEVGAAGSNQAEVEEANEEGKKAWRDAWRSQSAAKSQK